MLVTIGKVGRPHGTDGAFVVEGGSRDPRRFAVGASVLVEGAPATVVASRRVGKGRVAIYPIREYWLDIGRMEDFEQAHAEFNEVFP